MYVVNILVLIAFGIMPIAYLIIFADISRGIVGDIKKEPVNEESPNSNSFFVSRVPWVLFVGLGVLPLVLKKHLAELKIASILLFSGSAAFAALTTI